MGIGVWANVWLTGVGLVAVLLAPGSEGAKTVKSKLK